MNLKNIIETTVAVALGVVLAGVLTNLLNKKDYDNE